MNEAEELLPGKNYNQWWCQSCGQTYYEETSDFSTSKPSHMWENHDGALHKVELIAIFTHKDMFARAVPKRA
tara:strand:- start:754 stop:969 length:216 start_codon:yes stop_codon:yes gene_type:complete